MRGLTDTAYMLEKLDWMREERMLAERLALSVRPTRFRGSCFSYRYTRCDAMSAILKSGRTS